jgi:hypothetical protein
MAYLGGCGSYMHRSSCVDGGGRSCAKDGRSCTCNRILRRGSVSLTISKLRKYTHIYCVRIRLRDSDIGNLRHIGYDAVSLVSAREGECFVKEKL